MLPGWLAISVFLAYVAALFALARWGVRALRLDAPTKMRRAIYALSVCLQTSAWSYFGSVGLASRQGLAFLPAIVGPMFVFGVLFPLIKRIVRLSKSQSATSVADFVAARYGKSAAVAATVTTAAIVASIPFVAFQLRAIAQSLSIFVDRMIPTNGDLGTTACLVTIAVALLLTFVSIAIGARQRDTTRHLSGLMVVLGFESLVKLAAFLIVGLFVVWHLFDGIGDLAARLSTNPTSAVVESRQDASLWLSMLIATIVATLFVPRQFHVTIIENRDERDVHTAAWLVPLYLLATLVFVIPIAAAGLLIFPHATIDRDFTILALPIQANAGIVTLIALIGGFSAATSMAVLTATVVATMVSNNIILPTVLRRLARRSPAGSRLPDVSILLIRGLVIAAIFALAVLLTILTSATTFTSVGLFALLAFIQITPAGLLGLFWPRGTARGAVAGPVAGMAVCLYTLVLPAALPRSAGLIVHGPLGIDALRPTDLLDLDLAPFQQALLLSLAINTLVYVVFSLSRPATIIERLQAAVFVGDRIASPFPSRVASRSGLSVGDLVAGVSRYLDPSVERHFRVHRAADGLGFDPDHEADASLMALAESLMVPAIGTASAQLVIALLQQRDVPQDTALRIADDLAYEIQDSRDVLQHAIDVARDGMAVFDRDMRLVVWNRAYREMFQLPPHMMRIGVPLDALIRSNAERGLYGDAPIERSVSARLEALSNQTDPLRIDPAPFGRVLEMRSIRLHNGGIFFTYTDATERAKSEEELEAEKDLLEQRVQLRTEELQHLNFELARAKAEAEDANISKTRFLAASSHDLLQPLNAARLYTTSLQERLRASHVEDGCGILAANVDASLEAVEEILGALLEISHLDAGATSTEVSCFAIEDILRQLKMEFGPIAAERGLRFVVKSSSLYVMSDRRLLRRLLQNLISNALKYTPKGGVLVGIRRMGPSIRIDVCDTGLGIPKSKQQMIFREFTRLPAAAKAASGLGLGLSIVERLSRVLGHQIRLQSQLGKGSMFSVVVQKASLTPVRSAASPLAATFPRQRSLDGLAVAVIDNEPHILQGMEVLLLGWDCVVVSGIGLPEIETALEAAETRPDVIVADFHVGDIDGIAIVTALRQKHGFCPAVLITADRSPAVKTRALAEDIRVLNKPLKPAALRALLSQWRLVKAQPD